ncbi:MAG TPA: OmpA family protein [Bacteroidia bacterium]|jgi:peptidoglycan-associated lipoprotein|nr:OmpA family protein [Bacteroidia bacterium]
MKPTRLFTLVLLFPCLLFAQKEITYGDQQFEAQQYFTALTNYHAALAKCRTDANKAYCEFQIGQCYKMLSEWDDAKTFFSKAIKDGTVDDRSYLFLAQMEQQLGEYPRAIGDFTTYAGKVPSDPAAQTGIDACNNAIDWYADTTRWQLTNESQINTRYNDFCPTWSDKNHKSIIFSSKRAGQTGSKVDPISGMLYSDLFEARLGKNGKWSTPAAVAGSVNMPQANDGASSITKNGNRIYFTRCDQKKKQLISCKIYYSDKTGNSWGAPLLVDFGLDASMLDSFNFRHPAISANEEVMVFSSDMTGATGGQHSDLWISYYDKKTKTWGAPQNLGSSVNTNGREGFPYIAEDGTLYFSSDGLGGLGGLDLFKATKSANGWSWSAPENMKTPFNSPGDDFGIVIDGKKQMGYLTSNRAGSKGADDIWKFMYVPCDPTLNCVVLDRSSHVPVKNAFIDLVGSDGTAYSVTSGTDGKNAFTLKENVSYLLGVKCDSASSKFSTSYFSMKDDDRLKLTTLGMNLCHDFYDTIYVDSIPTVDIKFPAVLYGLDSADLRQQSKDSLNYLYELLVENPNLVIEIDAHTDSRGSAEHNRDLSQRRAQACVDYLISKGISKDRLVAKGWGPDAPLKMGKVVLTANYINSKTSLKEREALHQLNRRTTFKVLRTDYVDPKAPPRPPAPPVNVKKGFFDETGVEVNDDADGNN